MHHDMFREISDFIFMEDTPDVSDIIFLPGSSQSTYIETAARLYHAGYAPYILPSGRYSSTFGRFAAERIDNPRYYGTYPTEFAYCREVLLKNGVPDYAILCEDQATNSMENAQYSAQTVRRLGLSVSRAILSCQAFHARRAFLSYSVCMPDTEFCVVPTDTMGITRDTWYQTERGYKKVMGELSKCGLYFKDLHEAMAAVCKDRAEHSCV